MTDPVLAPDVSFTVRYADFVTGAKNLEFIGTGVLRVEPTLRQFVFSGSRRRWLRPPFEITFSESEISNVTVAGERIEFSTPKGVWGAKNKRFVFFCSQPQAVAALLPGNAEHAYVAANDFHSKLARIAGGRPAWASPTNVIIALNLAMFLVMGLAGAGWLQVTDLTQHIRFGANNGAATTDGQWWRLVASMFIHYGLIHLLLNMWALFLTGHLVERLFGRTLFVIGYLGSGIVGSFVSLIWHGDKMWSAGASGAIFGVYGLLLGYLWREDESVPRVVYHPLLKSTLAFAGYNLFFGAVHPQVDNAAHVGGFAGGLIFGLLMAVPLEAELRLRATRRHIALGAATLVAAIALGVVISPRFSYSVDEEISWAHAVRPRAVQEQGIIGPVSKEVDTFVSGKNSGEVLKSALQKAAEFYDAWADEVAQLSFTPGRRTAQRREGFIEILKLQADTFRRFAAELPTRSNDVRMRLATRYHNDGIAVGRKVQALRELK